jgi:cell division protein FtsZ
MIMPGLINLDFADIRTVMSEMGKAMMGTGEAEGENRALDAAQKAISNPLLDDVSMKGAKGVLINITGGPDMTLFEVDEAANRIRDEVDPDANIIFGSTFDESLVGRMRVSVVATGIDAAAMAQPKPTVISLAANRPAARPVVQSAPRSEGAAALKTEPMAAAQPIVATASQPVTAEAAPAVAQAQPTRTEPAFIAPRPAEPVQATAPQPQRAADPFAAADMANAAPRAEPVKEKRRGPSLFERVTGTGRARAQAPQAAAPAAPAAPTPAAQPRLGGLDPVDRATQPAQDDLLDIPAFLRRQAN